MQKIISVAIKERSLFHDLWQQHKRVKTMEISETWTDIYDGG